MNESKGNLLLNPTNQFFSSVHLNSSPINSPQGEILYRLNRKRTLHGNFIIRNGKSGNKIQQENCFFFLEGGEKEKRKYYTPTALTTANSAQFALCFMYLVSLLFINQNAQLP